MSGALLGRGFIGSYVITLLANVRDKTVELIPWLDVFHQAHVERGQGSVRHDGPSLGADEAAFETPEVE